MSDRSAARVADALEAFIRERFSVAPDDALFTRTVNLWEDGYVDSTGVVELIAFLEETFELTLPEEVLFSPDFRSIEGIANLVSTTPVST